MREFVIIIKNDYLCIHKTRIKTEIIMLLINKKPLEVGAALDNEKHPLHRQAKEYSDGLNRLKQMYPDGKLTLLKTGFPKYVDGIDSQGKEVRNMPEPAIPYYYPLSTNHTSTRGKEIWACCMGDPKILPGDLWDLGNKRSWSIYNQLVIDINDDPDFAYYVYYISRAVKGGHIKVADPKADVKAKADKKRESLERETAIWHSLSDEVQLRKIAQAYGVSSVDSKEPDAIRFELETVLKNNDLAKKKDPSYKGTKEFLEDMKITDYVRLSAFLRHWMDESKITYSPDGRYKIGDKAIAHVPTDQITKKFPYLCNYFAAPNNRDKLASLMKDLINKEYLDSLSDPKDFRWIAGVMELTGYYNKKAEEIREMVFKEFTL
jgi:hypothetical protein